MADTISYQLYGQPIHFTPERVGYTAKVGDWVRKKNDEGIPLAIDALCKYEPSDKGSRPPHEDTDNMSTSSIDDDIRPEVESLIVLLEKLQNWRSLPFHEVSPLMTSVEEIGETLYESGGVDAMERAYSSIAVRDADLSSQLDTFWEGIGKWKQ
jgi:hypothetical protein